MPLSPCSLRHQRQLIPLASYPGLRSGILFLSTPIRPSTMSAQPNDSKVTKDDQTTLDTVEPVHGIKSPTSAAHGGRAHVDGEHVKLERNFSAFAALAIAFSILNSWCVCCLWWWKEQELVG